MLDIRCKRLVPEAKLPTKDDPEDLGWDLYPSGYVKVTGRSTPVDTGIALAIPRGWGALVMGRSGLARKYGVEVRGVLLRHPDGSEEIRLGGVIDSGYRGPLIALLAVLEGYGAREFTTLDKCAQLILLPAPLSRMIDVGDDPLPPGSRGLRGFGDSGGNGSGVPRIEPEGPLDAPTCNLPFYPEDALPGILDGLESSPEMSHCRCHPVFVNPSLPGDHLEDIREAARKGDTTARYLSESREFLASYRNPDAH